MSGTIALLGWEAHNLRCPDHKVELSASRDSKPFRVTLIQMPNGTGKTTTLTMLRATLSGAAETWPENVIREFQKRNATGAPGTFLVFLSLDKKRMTIELTLDFENGLATYRTTFGAGVQKGFRPPPELRRFLNPGFVELFVFDGELAQRLLDNQQTRAREAIDQLFQLPLLERLREAVHQNWTEHVRKASSKQEKGLRQRKNRLNALSAKLDETTRRRKYLKTSIPRLEKSLATLNARYQDELKTDGRTSADLARLGLEKATNDGDLKVGVTAVIDLLRNPHALLYEFAAEMVRLKQNMDTLKLPASTAREFFEDLAKEDLCVCGRSLDESTRAAIRDRALGYLGEEESGVLNSMKGDIGQNCGPDIDSAKLALDGALVGLNEKVMERDRIVAEREAIEAIRIARGDSAFEALKLELDTKESTLEELKAELSEIDSPIDGSEDDETAKISSLVQRKRDAERAVAEATDTVVLKRRTDALREILQQAQVDAREKVKQALISDTNKRLSELLAREPVVLDDISECLILKNQTGASVGQTLAVSYAFLATLFERRDYQLPFVVDSPAGPLDLAVRPEVAKLIPKLCGQFVAFTISSEREKFVTPLSKAAGSDVQYLTLVRASSEAKRLIKNVEKSRVQTFSDGVLISEQKFFMSFDQDEEA